MKKLYLYIIATIATAFIVILIFKLGENTNKNTSNYKVFSIEGCEYIGSLNDGYSTAFTHKGNCKNIIHKK